MEGQRHYQSKSMAVQTVVNLLIQDANYFKKKKTQISQDKSGLIPEDLNKP